MDLLRPNLLAISSDVFQLWGVTKKIERKVKWKALYVSIPFTLADSRPVSLLGEKKKQLTAAGFSAIRKVCSAG